MPHVVGGDLPRQWRPRAHQAHLAADHVPELRQFVDAGAAQEATHAGDPRIVGDLEGGSADLVALLQLAQPLLGVGDHGAELEDLERSTVEADPRLPEEDRRDPGRDRDQQRAQPDQGHGGQRQVHGPLDRQAEDPVRSVEERHGGDAVELLHPRPGERQLDDVHGDADDLALVLAEAGDRLHQVPRLDRQADGDFVDDPFVEDVLDLIDGAEYRSRRDEGRLTLPTQVADDPKAELGVSLHAVGERLRLAAGPQHEQVAGVAAAPADEGEGPPQRRPRAERGQRLGREEEQQEEAADVRELDPEERAEGRHRDEQRRPPDRHRLAAQRPPVAGLVEPVEPERGDPGTGVDGRHQPDAGAGADPDGGPAAPAEAEEGDADEEGDRAQPVRRGQRDVQRGDVSTNHAPRPASDRATVPACRPPT